MESLSDLLSVERETSSKIVTIKAQVSSTAYSVVDKKNRQYIVESAIIYLPGTLVVIKNGVIIGKTKSSQNYKEYSL